MRYMYEGEVSVEEIDLAPLLTCARGLGIKGLCEVDSKSDNKVNKIFCCYLSSKDLIRNVLVCNKTNYGRPAGR